MKILDLNSYNEKLKIRPVNVNNLDEVDSDFINKINLPLKQRISTFDIVKLNGSLFMVFLNNDLFHITNVNRQHNDLVISMNYHNASQMMSLSDNKYDINLNYVGGLGNWYITDIWFHPKKFIFSGDENDLTQNNLKKWISDYRFIHYSKEKEPH